MTVLPARDGERSDLVIKIAQCRRLVWAISDERTVAAITVMLTNYEKELHRQVSSK